MRKKEKEKEKLRQQEREKERKEILIFCRFSFLLAGPQYFESSGLFKVSDCTHRVNAGDALYFLADSVCHRAPPPNSIKKDRRLVFWFSWDAVDLPDSEPDVDFQLNSWTLHHLLSRNIKYEDSLVCFFFLLFVFLFCFDHFFVGCSNLLDGVDGLFSIPTLPK